MKPTLTSSLKERFAAYHRENLAWGSLHIVLDDGNLDDHNVAYCIKWANANEDPEGAALGEILLSMSRTQRKKLYMDREV